MNIYTRAVPARCGGRTAGFVRLLLLDRGGFELNPIFERYPSPTKLAGVNAGIFSAQSLAFYLTERNERAWVR